MSAPAVHDAGVDPGVDPGPHGFFGRRCGMQVRCCLVVETALLQMRSAQSAVALDSTADSYQFMVSIQFIHLLAYPCYSPAADYQRGRKAASIELEWAFR